MLRTSRTRNLNIRDCVVLPVGACHRALLRSQVGPIAGAWLNAFPSEAATTLSLTPCSWPNAGDCACRIFPPQDGPSPDCGGQVDRSGDHTLACPRAGLFARRAEVVQHGGPAVMACALHGPWTGGILRAHGRVLSKDMQTLQPVKTMTVILSGLLASGVKKTESVASVLFEPKMIIIA